MAAKVTESRMVSREGGLSGLAILVVEDSYQLAEYVCGLLDDEGCRILGPASRLAGALALVETCEVIDGAILDINLAGEMCFPLATALAARGVPFMFVSGYDDLSIIPAEHAERPALRKPVEEELLLTTLSMAISQDAGK